MGEEEVGERKEGVCSPLDFRRL